jgi:hypothetical protein
LKDLGMNENIREDHKEIGCEDVDWIQILRKPLGCLKTRRFLDQMNNYHFLNKDPA